MSIGRAVRLVAHDQRWAAVADEEAARIIRRTPTASFLKIHHIGSTAISGIEAKPVIDLLPVAPDLATLDQANEEDGPDKGCKNTPRRL